MYIYNNWEVTSLFLPSNLVPRNETYLEIERALSRSMNNSSNAINNIIEFADFYLLERSEHRALSFSSSFFFFFSSYANTCAPKRATCQFCLFIISFETHSFYNYSAALPCVVRPVSSNFLQRIKL